MNILRKVMAIAMIAIILMGCAPSLATEIKPNCVKTTVYYEDGTVLNSVWTPNRFYIKTTTGVEVDINPVPASPPPEGEVLATALPIEWLGRFDIVYQIDEQLKN